MSFRSELRSYGEAFLRLVFPASCALCPQVLELEDQGVCARCRESLASARFQGDERVLDVKLPWIREAVSLYPYASPVREVLHAVKFLKKRWLLKLFNEDLHRFAEMFKMVSSYDGVIPVPMDASHLMNRHYNQSEILAGELASTLGVPMSLWLQKKHTTPAQRSLKQKDRALNLRGAFKISKPMICSGKRILLVDDVLTTGATASEAARILRENGAKSVDLLTLAHTRVHHPAEASLRETS